MSNDNDRLRTLYSNGLAIRVEAIFPIHWNFDVQNMVFESSINCFKSYWINNHIWGIAVATTKMWSRQLDLVAMSHYSHQIWNSGFMRLARGVRHRIIDQTTRVQTPNYINENWVCVTSVAHLECLWLELYWKALQIDGTETLVCVAGLRALEASIANKK